MKKKRLAAFAVALVIILSCGFSAFALTGLTLGEWISIGVNFEGLSDYTYQEWESMPIDDRRVILDGAVSAYGGTPHFTDDFLSDTSNSFNAYEGFANGYSAAGGIVPNIAASIYLELEGQADLRLGFYNSNGVYDDGTAADTLNDEFLDYIQQKPYSSSSILGGTLCYFDNGYSISWEPVYNYGHNPYNPVVVDGVSYKVYSSGVRLYLHDSSGTMIEMKTYCYGLNGSTAFVGSFAPGLYDDYHNVYLNSDTKFTIEFFDVGNKCFKSKSFTLPWTYGSTTSDPVLTDPTAVGVDDNGNTIEFNVNSDGVTYEGNTYNYNDDNSVTINGNTYYITVDPNTVDDDYYNQFLENVINNYYNYYNTTSTPFDATDIISSLKSIFTSLERFRSDLYSQIRNFHSSVSSGISNIKSSLSSILKKLDTIITFLKSIDENVENISEEQEEKNHNDWLELIALFKNKVGWSNLETSMSNISTAFFGERTYSIRSDGSVDVEITSSDGSRYSSSMPALSITFMGQSYELYNCVNYLGSGIDTIKGFISVFLWVGFIVSVFRSIPSIIGGVSSVQDHSNNVVVDKHTGEIKRGA